MAEAAVAPGRGTAEVERLPLTRRAMVRQMDAAALVPCFYLRATADMRQMLALRAELRSRAKGGHGPSVNDLLVRGVALALRAHPEVNASYQDGSAARWPRVNVGVAIAVPGGLVVPAVCDADRKRPQEIAEDVRRLADLGRRRKLSRDELSNATFTISNLGMYGVEEFDAVLNPPQAAILAVGAIRYGAGGTAELRLTLGCDHRVLTGAEGAAFLRTLREKLEDPAALAGEADVA